MDEIYQGIPKAKGILQSIIFFVCVPSLCLQADTFMWALALEGKMGFKLEIPLLTPLTHCESRMLFRQSESSDALQHP